MEADDLIPLLEQLEDNVDELEEVLRPLLQGSLCISDLSKKLPLLDRAKLHVLITYTLESLIFCKALECPCPLAALQLTLNELTCVFVASTLGNTLFIGS
jgi:hypothetical protein